MLIGGYVGAQAAGGVSRIAPLAARVDGAAVEVVGAGEDEGVLLGWDGGEGEVVVAVGDGGVAAFAGGFKGGRIELVGEG